MANGLTKFLAEAKRRRVFRTAGVYLVAIWGLSQGAVELAPIFSVPESFIRVFVVGAIAFLPVVVVLAWMFDIGRGGIVRDPSDVPTLPNEGDDIASMPTMVAGDVGHGAVIVRWHDVGGDNTAIFAEEFFMGRGSDCCVRFYDPLVSRRHARVYHENGAWCIEDLGSRNGTLVDEKQVGRSILPKASEIWLNEAGPALRLELIAPGTETRSAMSAFPPGQMIAHVRSDALSLDRQRRSEIKEK